jgi:TatD DNase family protein
MELIDTHCHLYLEDFDDDINDIIQKAETRGVKKFYLPAIDHEVVTRMLALEEQFPGKCIAMMGLHPCSVKENFRDELKIVEDWLQKRPFAAVGEIGLDYYWDKTFVKQQQEAFRTQVEWSLNYDLPIVIHTRNATQETINIVKEYVGRGVRGIFHCFSGSYESARDIIDAGFYLGIGGVITYKNAGVAQVLERIGVEHMVLETDSPYLTPVPFRGKRNESSYLEYVVRKLAEIKSCSEEDIGYITTRNAEKIFGL